MNDLLNIAITAHGGSDRWQDLKSLKARFTATGIFQMKGWPDVFGDARVSIDPHRQHAEISPFIQPDHIGLFEGEKTSILSEKAQNVDRRENSRQPFAGHGLTTAWDRQNLLYFSGYALWTYLTTPFLFMMPGFHSTEIEPWNEDGETWRRLKVTFPANISSHSTEQIFYFDSTGLLRRHDYSVDILGGTSSANYASEPREFGGIVIPTKRRVYAIGTENRPLRDRLAVAIDFHEIGVIRSTD